MTQCRDLKTNIVTNKPYTINSLIFTILLGPKVPCTHELVVRETRRERKREIHHSEFQIISLLRALHLPLSASGKLSSRKLTSGNQLQETMLQETHIQETLFRKLTPGNCAPAQLSSRKLTLGNPLQKTQLQET